jgi:hypothetical protein
MSHPVYEEFKWFLQEQISHQEYVARREGASDNIEKADAATKRAMKFKALLEALASHECRVVQVVQQVTKVETIDDAVLGILDSSPIGQIKISEIEKLLNGRATKAVIHLRISELVKRGKAWRMGEVIGLPEDRQ